MTARTGLKGLLSFLLCLTTMNLALAQNAQLPTTPSRMIRIVIVEGEGALNNIKLGTAREPIVQVEDENHKPVAGALVLFSLPDHGPSGLFANGSRTETVITNQNGEAKTSKLRPNNQAGQFEIMVTASFAGVVAREIIRESNIKGGGGTAVAHGGFTKWIVIGGVAAGAAVVAGVLATGSGNGQRGLTITPGAATVGPPR